MRRGIVLGGMMAIGSVTVVLAAYQALPQPALDATRIEQVKDNLYVITGSDTTNREAFSGGNTGVFVTEAGVVVVDTKLPGWGDVILDRIRTVTDKPIVAIINTHTHGDHAGSDAFFDPSIDIVAHENTVANMKKMDAFTGAGARFLPKRSYADRMSVGPEMTGSTCSTSDAGTPTATASSIPAFASCRWATCSRGRMPRLSTGRMAAAESSTRTHSPTSWLASRTSTPSSPTISRPRRGATSSSTSSS